MATDNKYIPSDLDKLILLTVSSPGLPINNDGPLGVCTRDDTRFSFFASILNIAEILVQFPYGDCVITDRERGSILFY